MSGFQSVINPLQAPAVAGDFASANPRSSVVSGPSQLVAGVGGCNVGVFAWADVNGLVTNAGSGIPTGFVHRNLQALNFNLLTQSTMNVPQGYGITLCSAGDFWAVTSTAATPGQKIFASNTTGAIQTGTAGATITGYTETKWFVPAAFSCNAGELTKMTTWN
jgi:hypothetical protein